jgi:hypothetical protein
MIESDFPEDWKAEKKNRSALLNEMIEFAIQHGFRIKTPVLRRMNQEIKGLKDGLERLALMTKNDPKLVMG